MVVVIVMACNAATRHIARVVLRPHNQMLVARALVIVLFVASEDFNLGQLLHVNSSDVTFRTGEFERFNHHWFWRRDHRSIARFLNEHRGDVDAAVVSINARSLPYYLDPQVHFAYYCSREGKDRWKYPLIARVKGTVERWTGRPLLGTEKELRDYTDGVTSLYLVRSLAPDEHDFDLNRAWAGRLASSERVHLSIDGRTEVLKLSLE
jgi:hypothetical protein